MVVPGGVTTWLPLADTVPGRGFKVPLVEVSTDHASVAVSPFSRTVASLVKLRTVGPGAETRSSRTGSQKLCALPPEVPLVVLFHATCLPIHGLGVVVLLPEVAGGAPRRVARPSDRPKNELSAQRGLAVLLVLRSPAATVNVSTSPGLRLVHGNEVCGAMAAPAMSDNVWLPSAGVRFAHPTATSVLSVLVLSVAMLLHPDRTPGTLSWSPEANRPEGLGFVSAWNPAWFRSTGAAARGDAATRASAAKKLPVMAWMQRLDAAQDCWRSPLDGNGNPIVSSEYNIDKRREIGMVVP